MNFLEKSYTTHHVESSTGGRSSLRDLYVTGLTLHHLPGYKLVTQHAHSTYEAHRADSGVNGGFLSGGDPVPAFIAFPSSTLTAYPIMRSEKWPVLCTVGRHMLFLHRGSGALPYLLGVDSAGICSVD